MIRDDEIKRLISYANGLGCKVTFNRKDKDNSAEWALDGSEIVIFTLTNTTKTETILSLVHELGHEIFWIYEKSRKPDLKFEEAIDRQNLFFEDLASTPAPKKHRQKILKTEIAGTAYWEAIWKETNIQLPKWKLIAAMEFDIWMYEVYAKTGHFPKGKIKKNRIKEIKARHRAN